ncbi:MAG TPA: homoserine kinase [Woeseiaceae bacterium]|nr:homoserine kinase [Woeseiaceae bacterium]
MSAAGSVAAFAPASIGNVAVGFDMLGLAVAGVGDTVTARRTSGRGVRVAAVLDRDGEPHPELAGADGRNTASIAAAALWEAHGAGGLELVVEKGIPLESGMGSSAASAVAAVVAANALLERPLAQEALLPFALEGERFASGSVHADNVAPSLLGGLVLCPVRLLPRAVRIATPAGVSSVLLHPELRVDTASARRSLARSVEMAQWLEQQGCLAAFIAACEHGEVALIGETLRDVIIEPQRAARVPPFAAVKAAALEAGALGCSLSGSGPSIFALCEDARASAVAGAMAAACRETGVDCETWISPMDAPGARLVTPP